MKNKNRTFLLLATTILVWGIIGYKIINGVNPENPIMGEKNIVHDFKPKPHIKQDTFTLAKLDRDPFLGTLYTKSEPRMSKKKLLATNDTLPALVITYGGMIRKENTSSKIFVVNIDNEQALLKIGQNIGKIKLVSGTKSSIKLSVNGTIKNIALK